MSEEKVGKKCVNKNIKIQEINISNNGQSRAEIGCFANKSFIPGLYLILFRVNIIKIIILFEQEK